MSRDRFVIAVAETDVPALAAEAAGGTMLLAARLKAPADLAGRARPLESVLPPQRERPWVNGVDWLRSAARSSGIVSVKTGDFAVWPFIESSVYRYAVKPVVQLVDALCRWHSCAPGGEFVVAEHGHWSSRVARACLADLGAQVRTIRSAAPPEPAPAGRRTGAEIARDALRRLTNPRPPGPGGVLLASGGRTQFSIGDRGVVAEDLVLEPIIRAMAARSHGVMLFRFARGTAIRVPHRPPPIRNVPWESFGPLIPGPGIARRQAAVERAIDSIARSDDFQRAWTFCGVNLWQHAGEFIASAIGRYARQATRHLSLAPLVIAKTRPALLVVANETALDNRPLVAAAARSGIPSAAVQHGAIVPSDDYYADLSTPACEPGDEATLFPGLLCVFDDKTVETLKAIGYPRLDRVVVTGQPRFDALADPAPRNREAFRRRFQLADRPIVLVGSQTFQIADARERFYDAVFEGLAGARDWSLVIKPHPAEDVAALVRQTGGRGARVVVLPRDLNVHDALRACDVLVTFYSTLALEAMLLQRPVVILNPTGLDDPVDWARESAARHAATAGELARAVRDCLEGGPERARVLNGARHYLADRGALAQGSATARTLEAISTELGARMSEQTWRP